MTDYLTAEQVDTLLRDIRPHRVKIMDGNSHLEGWDVRAHLTRVFGFARWSADLVDLVPLYEASTTTRAGKDAYRVGYRATMRLTVRAPSGGVLATYTEAAAGESLMPEFKRGDCHDMAIKTAETQALKRCAVNLGTQFGLSLYRNGQTSDVVLATLVHPDAESAVDEAPEPPVQPLDEPLVHPDPEMDPNTPDHRVAG